MLSGLAVCAALTAIVAGVAGAWSPCGFSMVETIGSALGDRRRGATFAASAAFTVGAVLGGVLTFGGLALAGRLLDPGAGGVRLAVGAAIAVAAAAADWRGVKIAPQIRRQVPERWRWTAPLPLACGLYGILLGLGFTTFVLAFAVWALAGISFAAGDLTVGIVVGVAFGIGRALPVLWMAPSLSDGRGGERLDQMASEPRMWLGLRRLDALGLSLCALFLGGASASAAVLPGASDPSAAGGQLAWQQPGGAGVVRLASGQAVALPGGHPALGGSRAAWSQASDVVIADDVTLKPVIVLPLAGVDALAVSGGWLVYRVAGPQGERLLARSLLGAPTVRLLAGARPAGVIGRPALQGSTVVFAESTARSSVIVSVELSTGARRVLRSATRSAQFLNPSIQGRRLLYERIDRCSQELRLGPLGGHGAERVLLTLPSTVVRDTGYQVGYEHAWNMASLCPNRGSGRPRAPLLGATALSARQAFVTEQPSRPADARIVTLAR